MPALNRTNTTSRYLVAALVTILALIARLLLGQVVEASSPFLLFTPAVLVAAWYGGLGPGLFATFVGAVVADYFLLAPLHKFSYDTQNIGRMLVFVLVGLQISWLGERMHAALRRAEADAQSARRSEKLYRTLAANFPDGFVCLFDRELRWTLVAGAGLEAAKLSREQMEGRPIVETLPLATGNAVKTLCIEALSGAATEREVVYGDRVYFCHALPLKSQEETSHVGMVILEDVTERVRARESLQWAHDNLERRVGERTAELRFQKTLLESQSQASADGILAVGEDGRVIFANDRLSRLWQLPGISVGSPSEGLRRMMLEQLRSHERDPLSPERDASTVEEPGGAEELILQDGRTIERYSSPIVDPDGSSYGRVWFFRDITERKRLQRQILEAGERERERIGQDLHDDLCQQLAGIACLGQAMHRRLGRQEVREEDRLAAAEIVERVQHANQHARDLAKGLQPVQLQREGVAAAMRELCGTICDVFGVACTFNGEGIPLEVDEAVGTQLYRICQEATSNAIRHGKARRLFIDLIGVADRLILTIEDDGTGIPQPLPENGMGLYTMNYRARVVGGVLTIERRQPHGTIVTCSVPLRPDNGSSPAMPTMERPREGVQ